MVELRARRTPDDELVSKRHAKVTVIQVIGSAFQQTTHGTRNIGDRDVALLADAPRVLRYSFLGHMNQRSVPAFPPSTTRLRQFRKSVYVIVTI